ncbi:MAG: DUF2339 domain-containing protein [Candidatus Woesearchaeota archaeon]
MPTNESLKKEIDLLKKEYKKVNKLISCFEKNQNKLNKRISALEKLSVPIENRATEEKKTEKSTPVGGIILIVVGVLLSLSFFGLIIGLPILIWGIVLVSKSSKSTISKVKEEVKPRKVEKKVKAEKVIPLKPEKKVVTFEEDVGMKWFSRIGILALVIGVGFFIKYAIDVNWIDHLTRIIMGIVFGIGLIIFGEIVSKKEKYANWAKTLVGGGFAITYFVIFAAYHFPEYQAAIGISQILNIILLSLVVIFAILFALKDNSQIIAAESFFLGYVTYLLSNDFGFMTIIYGLLLTIGLVIVVCYKKWSVIGLGGVVASYIMYLLWNNNNPESFLYASFILISYFVAFSIQSFFLIKNNKVLRKNILIILINSVLFFILYYNQIDKHYPVYAGLFALIFSIIYFIGYYFFKTIEEEKLATTHLYLALLYFTITIPIQLNKEWITIIWALETLILTIMYVKMKINTLKISSYVVGVITILKTFFYDLYSLNKLDFVNLINSTRLFSFLVTIICFYIVYKLLRNNKKILTNDESVFSLVYSWSAFGFLILIIFIELIAYHAVWITIILSFLALAYIIISKFDRKEIRHQSISISALLFLKVLLYDSFYLRDFNPIDILSSTRFFAFLIAILTFYIISWYLERNKHILEKSEFALVNYFSYAGTILAFILVLFEMKEFWISIGWSILALIISISGFLFRKKHLRMQGMIIFSITIIKVFLYDTRSLETIYRTVSYIVLGLILLLVSFIYTKNKEKLKEVL